MREVNSTAQSLNDLKCFVIDRDVNVKHIASINPGRGCHFFDKINDRELIIGLGYDFDSKIPLDDFLL